MNDDAGDETQEDGPRRVVFSGRMIEVVNQEIRLPNGKIIDSEFAERSPGVRVILTDGHRYLITRELRRELGRWDYRLPGGKVFDTLASYAAAREDRSVAQAARLAAVRELSEETQLSVRLDDMHHIYTSVAGATVVWDLYYFVTCVGEEVAETAPKLTHEGEFIARHFLEPQEVLQLIVTGQFGEDRSAAILARLLLGSGQQDWGLPPPPTLQWT